MKRFFSFPEDPPNFLDKNECLTGGE